MQCNPVRLTVPAFTLPVAVQARLAVEDGYDPGLAVTARARLVDELNSKVQQTVIDTLVEYTHGWALVERDMADGIGRAVGLLAGFRQAARTYVQLTGEPMDRQAASRFIDDTAMACGFHVFGVSDGRMPQDPDTTRAWRWLYRKSSHGEVAVLLGVNGYKIYRRDPVTTHWFHPVMEVWSPVRAWCFAVIGQDDDLARVNRLVDQTLEMECWFDGAASRGDV